MNTRIKLIGKRKEENMDEEMLELLFPDSYGNDDETLSILNTDSDWEGDLQC